MVTGFASNKDWILSMSFTPFTLTEFAGDHSSHMLWGFGSLLDKSRVFLAPLFSGVLLLGLSCHSVWSLSSLLTILGFLCCICFLLGWVLGWPHCLNHPWLCILLLCLRNLGAFCHPYDYIELLLLGLCQFRALMYDYLGNFPFECIIYKYLFFWWSFNYQLVWFYISFHFSSSFVVLIFIWSIFFVFRFFSISHCFFESLLF